MNTVENEKKRTSTLYLEVVPDSGPKRAATPDLNRWQTEWKLIRLEKMCLLSSQHIFIYSGVQYLG